jgi:hypothetical protein
VPLLSLMLPHAQRKAVSIPAGMGLAPPLNFVFTGKTLRFPQVSLARPSLSNHKPELLRGRNELSLGAVRRKVTDSLMSNGLSLCFAFHRDSTGSKMRRRLFWNRSARAPRQYVPRKKTSDRRSSCEGSEMLDGTPSQPDAVMATVS